MSIYTDEGCPKMGILAEDIADEFGATCAYELNSLTVTLPGISKLPICTIRLARQPFCVRIEAPDGSVANRDTFSSILARVRELAEAARETGNDPKVKPITEAEMATMDPPFPPEQIENARNKIPEKLTTGLVKPVEEAPAEPTLRELMGKLRDIAQAECDCEPWDWEWQQLLEFCDSRLGKEGIR